MLLSDVMAIVFSVLAALLSFQGLWLLSRSLWPDTVERCTADLSLTLWKPFFVGLPLTVITFILVTQLSKLGSWGGITAVAIVSCYVLLSFTGVSGLVSVLGARLNDNRGTVRTMILGGLALELAFVFPIVGWFFVLPISLIVGSGAAVRALVRKPGSKTIPKVSAQTVTTAASEAAEAAQAEVPAATVAK